MLIAGIVRYAGSASPVTGDTAEPATSPLAALASGAFWLRVLMFCAGLLALSVIAWELVKNG